MAFLFIKPSVSPTTSLSSEELSAAQVVDSNDPLESAEPVAGCSYTQQPTVSPPPPPLASTSEHNEQGVARASGKSGRRKHPYVSEIRSLWNICKLLTALGTEEQCVAFAEEHRLIRTKKDCPYHHSPMVLRTTGKCGHLGSFHCGKGPCRSKSESRAKGTWFENTKLKLNTIFLLMYMFAHKASYADIQRETAKDNGESVLSMKTIADWFSYCREAIVVYEFQLVHNNSLKNPMLQHTNSEGKIGGPSKVVQLDRFKFGKRKYKRGRHIEGHWVLGMIENGSDDLRLELCPDNERTSDALVPLIQKHVKEGTEIHTDFWQAYDCLPRYGYIHKKCNHSDPINRVVASDGTHTQRIQSHWRFLKVTFHNEQNKGDFTDWLIEYNWRRKIRINFRDPFVELLNAVKYVYSID